MHDCLREVKNSLFFLQALLFTAFLVTVLKKFNIRACELMILGQLRMGARQTKNAPLSTSGIVEPEEVLHVCCSPNHLLPALGTDALARVQAVPGDL